MRQAKIVRVDDRDIVGRFASKSSGWKSEAEFGDFIEANVTRLCHEIFGSAYKSHQRQWYLARFTPFGGNRPRMDLMVVTQDGKRHGVEYKYPRGVFHELASSVSQLLAYATIADSTKQPIDELWIFTTQYNDILRQVIEKYELPIRVVVWSRTERAELVSVRKQ